MIQDPDSMILDLQPSRTCDPGSWSLDLGSRILDTRSWTQHPGSTILDPRSAFQDPPIQDPVYRTLDRGSWMLVPGS